VNYERKKKGRLFMKHRVHARCQQQFANFARFGWGSTCKSSFPLGVKDPI